MSLAARPLTRTVIGNRMISLSRFTGLSPDLGTKSVRGLLQNHMFTRLYAVETQSSLEPGLRQQPRRPSPYGQPMACSHPHLFQKGELTPGISATEYELRRATLMHDLPDQSCVILVGARIKYMSNQIFYRFHQNTDFAYLTGFHEPDSIVTLEKTSGPGGYKMTMFLRPKDKEIEMWEGARTGLEGAISQFGADEAYEISHATKHLQNIISRNDTVYIDLPNSRLRKFLLDMFVSYGDMTGRSVIFELLPSLIKRSKSVKALSPLIQGQRIIKSSSEAALMRQAGEISALAFIETFKYATASISEQSLCSKFEFECVSRGAQMLAYVPVVAGGPNALSIHYTANDHLLQNGDLVLMDAGCIYHGYTSDITRTFPVSGRFTDAQRELYQAVLNVEKACIKMCTEPASISLNGLHNHSVNLMREELGKIGFNVSPRNLDRLYAHHLSHYLGMDVHDTPDIDRCRKLVSGMVLTVEPGIYVPQEPMPGVPERFRGIGIRIEDDVLVQKDDYIILSVTAPKEIVDIEAVANDTLHVYAD